jgi:hypothetical protein
MEAIRAIGSEALALPAATGRVELWLWEHAVSVADLATQLAQTPEFARPQLNNESLLVAGLFSLAGWAVQAREGKVVVAQVLGRATSGVQRELAAGVVQEKLAGQVGPEVLTAAVEAIRQCNDRSTTVLEAQILADAENVADIGVFGFLRQYRQYQAEGRSSQELLAKWQRLKEYQFWEARINNSLRSELAQRLARARLAAADQVVAGLEGERRLVELGWLLPEG